MEILEYPLIVIGVAAGLIWAVLLIIALISWRGMNK